MKKMEKSLIFQWHSSERRSEKHKWKHVESFVQVSAKLRSTSGNFGVIYKNPKTPSNENKEFVSKETFFLEGSTENRFLVIAGTRNKSGCQRWQEHFCLCHGGNWKRTKEHGFLQGRNFFFEKGQFGSLGCTWSKKIVFSRCIVSLVPHVPANSLPCNWMTPFRVFGSPGLIRGGLWTWSDHTSTVFWTEFMDSTCKAHISGCTSVCRVG